MIWYNKYWFQIISFMIWYNNFWFQIMSFMIWYQWFHGLISVISWFHISDFMIWYQWFHGFISVNSWFDISNFMIWYQRFHDLMIGAVTSPNTISISDAGNSQTCRTIFQGQSLLPFLGSSHGLLSRLYRVSSATSISTTNSTSTS